MKIHPYVSSHRGSARVLAAAIALACMGGCAHSSGASSDVAEYSGASSEITRGDLVGETTVQGTLHYADSYTQKSAFDGVITALPTPGSTIKLGERIYTVGGQSSYLLHGNTPAWRTFESGMSDGEDVKQLEESLAKLGHFTAEADSHFDWRTQAAISQWQKSLGISRDGVLPLGQVLFASEDLRVGALKARVGDSAANGTELFAASSSRQIISANLQLSAHALGVVGSTVTIRLPGAQTTKGTISSVEPPKEKTSSEGADQQGTTKDRIIPITVTPDDPAATEKLQEASVSLGITSQTKKDVLSVPLGALVAITPDQFGVEVIGDDGKTTRVPVQTGLFAGDRVEVAPDDLHEGQRVVVPNR